MRTVRLGAGPRRGRRTTEHPGRKRPDAPAPASFVVERLAPRCGIFRRNDFEILGDDALTSAEVASGCLTPNAFLQVLASHAKDHSARQNGLDCINAFLGKPRPRFGGNKVVDPDQSHKTDDDPDQIK